ncbi:TY-Chap domain-containing protein [Catellatospora chokoriensis]|uniref:TY-Chap domain-containing protein n=1 Tax=Catellatospora chokoriensis TaxID=310353 RepID=UPI003571189D
MSSSCSPRTPALTGQEEQQLIPWGWQAPETGDENWYIDAWPISTSQAEQAARLLRQTIQLVLRAAEPGLVQTNRGYAHGADPRRHHG